MNNVSKLTKWSYCIGATGRDAAYTLVSMFVLTYIQYTMYLSMAQFSVISTAMVICMVWDAVNDLIMSAIIENSRFKAGKFRPFIIVGAILNAIVIMAMFIIRPQGWRFVAFFVVAYLLWGMTYTVNDIAYWGMLPSLTSDPKERDGLVTTMGVFVCIGQFMVAGIVPVIIAGNAVAAFRATALIVGLGFILFQTLTFWGVTEAPRSENEVVTVKGMFEILKRNDQLISSGVAYVFFCLGQQLLLLLAVNFFYFEFGYGGSGDLITIFTVMYGLGTLGAQFTYPAFTKKLNRMDLIKLCMAVLVVCYLVFLGFGYVFPKSVLLLFAVGFIIFFCQGLYNLTMIVMINNTVEYDELRYGQRHDSIISAIRSFASKLSGALNQGAASLILIFSGIYQGSQNISQLEVKIATGAISRDEALVMADQYTSGINDLAANVLMSPTFCLRIGMVAVPLAAMLLAFFILARKYKIDETEYDRIVAELRK